MPPFEFQSPGANAYQAIQNYMLQREAEKRQALLDQLAQQKQEEDLALRRDDLALRRQTEARQGTELSETRKALEQERGFRRATTMVENSVGGAPIDEAGRALLDEQGYGGAYSKVPGILQQGALQSTDENDVPFYDVTQTPDSYQMRGGYKWQALQDAQQARTDAAKAAADAAAQRAEDKQIDDAREAQRDRASRELIAGIIRGSNANRNDTITFNQIAGAYERSPLVRAADRTIIAKSSIDAVRKDPKSAPNQMNLAYTYIQILDSYQSAVREGELQNIAGLATQLENLRVQANRIYSSGAFMPPELATQIATATEQLVGAIEAGRDQKQREFASRAQVSGVGDMWSRFVGGFQGPAAGGGGGGRTKYDMNGQPIREP